MSTPTPEMLRDGNARSDNLRVVNMEVEWKIYDRLPPDIRAQLRDDVLDQSCTACGEFIQSHLNRGYSLERTFDILRHALRRAEREEIVEFARAYYKTYKSPYPHTAAQATPLRYNTRRS